MDFYTNEDQFLLNEDLAPSSPVRGISYEVIADLATEPVLPAFFKLHARIDYNTDDELITSYIKSARQYLEQWSQLSFGTKTIRFTALKVPAKWKLMFGPYTAIAGTDYTLFGNDILVEAGTDVDIELTSGWALPEAVKIAICKRAAGDYCIRENYIISDKGAIQTPDMLYDEAQKLLQPYMNISWP